MLPLGVPIIKIIQCLCIMCLAVLFSMKPALCFSQTDSSTFTSPNDRSVSLRMDSIRPLKDSTHQLQEVKVYTATLPQVLKSIDPVEVVTRALPQWQDGLSAADMIRYFSGVQLKDYGGIGGLKTINVRSLGSRHTAVLLDGLPLENAQNGQVDLGRYALSDLGSIAIYKNQNSHIFQPATAFASSNAIYLETRTAQLDSMRRAMGTLHLQAGSFGLLNGSFYGAAKWGQYWQVQGGIAGLKTSGEYPFTYTNGVYDTTLNRDNGDVKRFQGRIGLYGKFKDSSTLAIVAYAFRRQMGLPGAIVSNKYENRERQDEADYYLHTAYLKPVSSKDRLKVQLKYNNSYLRYSNPAISKLYVIEGDTVKGTLTNHYRQSSYFFSAANIYQLTNDWHIDLSTDVHYDHLKLDLNGARDPSRWTGYAALASYLEKGPLQFAGNILYTTVYDHEQVKKDWITQNKWSPSISGSWQPFATRSIKLRVFYKKSFQMPTFNDLYLTQYNQTTLRPENSEQYNMGLSYYKSWNGVIRSVLMQADLYYNKVKDKIVAIPTTSLFRWQMTNLGLAKIKGLDFSLKGSFALASWHLTGAIQYTYQEAKDYTDPGSITYKNILPYIPTHSGSFTVSASNGHFGLNYSFIYDGERYSERYNSLVSYVPAWYTHDLALHYRLPPSSGLHCTILLVVDNVLNQQYDVIENYPMPGRNFKAGFQIEF